MIFLRWCVYGLAFYMIPVGCWDHSWRLILAGLSVWIIYPLVSSEIEEVALPTCSGCTKGRIVPGCPIHDPERRRNGEDSQTRKGTGASVA